MDFKTLIISILVPMFVSGISVFFFTRNAKSVFDGLKKPSFALQSSSLFGPVWTVLYLLLGIFLYRVLKSEGNIKINKLLCFK